VGLSLVVWDWLLVGSLVGQCWLYLDLARYHTTICTSCHDLRAIIGLLRVTGKCPEQGCLAEVEVVHRQSPHHFLPTLLYPTDMIKMSPEIPKKMKALRVNSGNQQVSPSDNANKVGNTIHSRKLMSPLQKVMKLSSRFTLLECVIRIY